MTKRGTVAYYRLDVVLVSALSIGTADSVETDNDIVRDSRGLPLIPATSLAGVYRSYFNATDASTFFGRLVEEGDLTESLVRVYDGTLLSLGEHDVRKSASISVRNNVRLGKPNKVAEDGLKFDRQVVERGATFRTYIEVTDCDVRTASGEEICTAVESMLAALDAGQLALGSKTSRGLGRIKIADCKRAVFDLDEDAQLDRWLEFDLFEDTCWDADYARATSNISDVELLLRAGNDVVITLQLAQCGAISIREYSTEPGRSDFETLHIRESRAGKVADLDDVAVVPGTSWAGAFRSRYQSYAGKEATRRLFGDVWREATNPTDDMGRLVTKTRRSRIAFSESEIRGGGWKEITRNSIDRFTGDTKEHAFFKLRTHYSGYTSLEIRVRCEGETWDYSVFENLVACIADLHNGFLAVGGIVSVGHGLFKVAGATCELGGTPIEGLDLMQEILSESAELEGYATPNVHAIAKKMVDAIVAKKGSDAS